MRLFAIWLSPVGNQCDLVGMFDCNSGPTIQHLESSILDGPEFQDAIEEKTGILSVIVWGKTLVKHDTLLVKL